VIADSLAASAGVHAVRSSVADIRGCRLTDQKRSFERATQFTREQTFADPREQGRRQRITSSARIKIDSGTTSPSSLAVLRLTTSSNLVGC